MPIDWNPISERANGGTEILCRAVEARVPRDLLDNFQIIPSRVMNPLDPTKVRVLWLHDLDHDPAAARVLENGGWRRFHRLVFVSHWQMGRFIERYGIDWSRCVVMLNAIDPLPVTSVPSAGDPVRLIYTSTPQRGLDVLTAVFERIASEDPDVRLDVFSSFKVYGWDEADQQYEELFEKLRSNSRVSYHGARPNAEIREALSRAHVFAYPSTWQETSCLCLMEAMSAGLLCVHPDLGALFETAANMTMMYHWSEDKNAHASVFYEVLRHAIARVREGAFPAEPQKVYADAFYSWSGRIPQWEAFLRSIVDLPRDIEASELFEYRSVG